MLYIFYGSDAEQARERANKLAQGLLSKRPEAELVRITEENVAEMSLGGLLATQGLFKSSYIIFFDNLGDVYKEWGSSEYKSMHNSEHICILLAEKLGANILQDMESHNNNIVECKTIKKQSQYNIFGVASALKSRDKKRLWLELVEARQKGQEAEGVTGMLFWAVKDMLLKGQHGKWSESELKELIMQLSELPHKARREGVSVYNALEHWVLICNQS